MRHRRPARTFTINPLESLDERVVPTTLSPAAVAAAEGFAPGIDAANEAVVASKTGPALSAIYQEFINYGEAGSQGAFSPSEAGQILFSGTAVGVDISASSGNYSNLLGQLQGMGMAVTATSAQDDIIEGYLPIWELPLVVTNANEATINPTYVPISR